MARPLILALDQGGHASRALVYDARGRLLAAARRPVATRRPRAGWVEQDAGELAATLEDAAAEALERAGRAGGAAGGGGRAGADTVAGLACQRSTVVCWDRETGEPLAPALSWQDRRAAPAVAALAGHAARVEAVTGLPLSPHYGAAKIAWCMERLPRVAAAARHGRLACGPLASWLVFRLTGGRRLAADPANAGRTQLLDLATLDWDPGLLELFGVPRAVLPDPAPTLHPFGRLEPAGAALGAVTGDQAAALFAGGRPAADAAYLNLGTGAFVQRPLAARPGPAPGMLAGVACHDPRPGGLGTAWVLEGAVNGAGAAVETVAAEQGIDRPAERLAGWLEDADAEPPLFLNGVAGLGSPWWRPRFRSRFTGDRADRAEPRLRLVAVAESVAFLVAVNLERLAAAGPAGAQPGSPADDRQEVPAATGPQRPASARPGRSPVPLGRIVATGGLARWDGLCRRLAALTGLPVDRPAAGAGAHEATARGIAWLAAGGPEDWEPPPTERFEPRPDPALAARFARWREAMAEALAEPDDVEEV